MALPLLALALGWAWWRKQGLTLRAVLIGITVISACAPLLMESGEAADHDPAVRAVVMESAVEAHEEAADIASPALLVLGAASAAAAFWYRKAPQPPAPSLGGLLVGLVVVTGWLWYVGWLGGKVRHTEFAGDLPPRTHAIGHDAAGRAFGAPSGASALLQPPLAIRLLGRGAMVDTRWRDRGAPRVLNGAVPRGSV